MIGENSMCINEESCKRNLVPTVNRSERFGVIFICENCKRYYAKLGRNIFELEFIKEENRWKMVC